MPSAPNECGASAPRLRTVTVMQQLQSHLMQHARGSSLSYSTQRARSWPAQQEGGTWQHCMGAVAGYGASGPVRRHGMAPSVWLLGSRCQAAVRRSGGSRGMLGRGLLCAGCRTAANFPPRAPRRGAYVSGEFFALLQGVGRGTCGHIYSEFRRVHMIA